IFFFQAEDGIRDFHVTGVQTCALPILDHQDVNINDLASAVVDSMQLQLQKHDAQMHMHLDAEDDLVVGDELHLSNVLFNLVDNRSEERRVGKSVDLGGRRIIKR